MAGAIAKQMTNESNGNNNINNDAIIATTITSYAVSSIVTGLVFLLGKLKLGVLVGFSLDIFWWDV